MKAWKPGITNSIASCECIVLLWMQQILDQVSNEGDENDTDEKEDQKSIHFLAHAILPAIFEKILPFNLLILPYIQNNLLNLNYLLYDNVLIVDFFLSYLALLPSREDSNRKRRKERRSREATSLRASRTSTFESSGPIRRTQIRPLRSRKVCWGKRRGPERQSRSTRRRKRPPFRARNHFLPKHLHLCHINSTIPVRPNTLKRSKTIIRLFLPYLPARLVKFLKKLVIKLFWKLWFLKHLISSNNLLGFKGRMKFRPMVY